MKARSWRLLAALVAALLLLFEASCGSVLYVNQVTRKASASVVAAEAVEAQTYAPYHYHLAVAYLRKAREEAAAADYQAANRFGERSYEAAEKARELAVERAATPTDVLWKPPPGTPGYSGDSHQAEPANPDDSDAGESPTLPNTKAASSDSDDDSDGSNSDSNDSNDSDSDDSDSDSGSNDSDDSDDDDGDDDGDSDGSNRSAMITVIEVAL